MYDALVTIFTAICRAIFHVNVEVIVHEPEPAFVIELVEPPFGFTRVYFTYRSNLALANAQKCLERAKENGDDWYVSYLTWKKLAREFAESAINATE